MTLTRLNTIAADPGHRFYEADLSRLSEMKRIAGEIAGPSRASTC